MIDNNKAGGDRSAENAKRLPTAGATDLISREEAAKAIEQIADSQPAAASMRRRAVEAIRALPPVQQPALPVGPTISGAIEKLKDRLRELEAAADKAHYTELMELNAQRREVDHLMIILESLNSTPVSADETEN